MMTLLSCSEYERVLKSKDMNYKQRMADEYYSRGQYSKSNTLMQEVLQYNRTSKNYEDNYYKYAMSFYNMENYWDAAIYFNSFASNFPNSENVEQAEYLAAKCYDNESNRYSLDQTDTRRAIDAYTSFKMKYPDSKYQDDVQESIDGLFDKLEKKEYEAAKLYYKIEQYKAAAVYFKEMIVKYPRSRNLESYKVQSIESQIKYADNSTGSKKLERYQEAMEYIEDFQYNHRQSDYDEKLNKLKTQTQTKINNINNGQ